MYNVVPTPTLLTQLTALLAEYPTTSLVHLYTNNFQPTPASVVGDFTEATFTGYTAATLTAFGTPFLNAANNAQSVAPGITFTCTGTTVTQTVYGYFITDVHGTTLLLSGLFDTPVNMNAVGVGFVFVPSLELGGLTSS